MYMCTLHVYMYLVHLFTLRIRFLTGDLFNSILVKGPGTSSHGTLCGRPVNVSLVVVCVTSVCDLSPFLHSPSHSVTWHRLIQILQ